jgi:redox-sensitive bicupin YhaK (pirin superfamily)
MLSIRRSHERGGGRHGWLETRHTFSFGDYYDPRHMGFRALRVINEDTIAPGAGFPTHGLRDMEILTYVLEGLVEHKDSTGGHGIIQPGEVQRMTAGRGVRHSEFNGSKTESLHLLQIWLLPESVGLAPGYEQKRFDDRTNRLRLVASRDGRDGSLTLHQDASVYAALLGPGIALEHQLGKERHAFVQVARGCLRLNGEQLDAGDGAALSDEADLRFESVDRAEFLLFDLG